MSQTQCRRCGGQISTNSTSCPWCGSATAFNLVGPLVVVALVLFGVAFGLGFIRWQWLEQALGLDRGFTDQVVTADAGSASGGGPGGDLTWRLPPGPDPADNYGGATRGPAPRRVPTERPAPAPTERVAAVVHASHATVPTPGGPGCADSSAIGRLVSRYPLWSNSDLALISCGRVRSGFSSDQVRAALGTPARVSNAGPGREQWRYNGVSVIVEQGRVISYGQ
jgi:hypothetical protein